MWKSIPYHPLNPPPLEGDLKYRTANSGNCKIFNPIFSLRGMRPLNVGYHTTP